MTAEERRKGIEQVLSQSPGPVSAAALARRFGVSRQIIVGDVALLRAAGAAIDATPRGYVTRRGSVGLVRQVACRHAAADMEQELNMWQWITRCTVSSQGPSICAAAMMSSSLWSAVPRHDRYLFSQKEFISILSSVPTRRPGSG